MLGAFHTLNLKTTFKGIIFNDSVMPPIFILQYGLYGLLSVVRRLVQERIAIVSDINDGERSWEWIDLGGRRNRAGGANKNPQYVPD